MTKILIKNWDFFNKYVMMKNAGIYAFLRTLQQSAKPRLNCSVQNT